MAKNVFIPQKNWQSELSLVDCNKYMLNNQIACDVKFLVGEEPNPELIPAHKFFLASRSSVMFAMFFGEMAEIGTIRITDVEAEIFKEFLTYLYTDQVTLTGDNVCHLLYAANKYDVGRLMEMCAEFLERIIQVQNVCFIMENAHLLGVKELVSTCERFIVENISTIFAANKQIDLCLDCLDKIISADDLSTKEILIFKAVMAWTDIHCKRQKLPLSAKNKRQVMGKLLYKIRFPLMDAKEFSDATDSGVLNNEEQIDVFKCLATGGERTCRFSCKPRLPTEHICLRSMEKNLPFHQWGFIGSTCDSVRVSQNVMATGLVIIHNNYQNEVAVNIFTNDLMMYLNGIVHQETQSINMGVVDSNNLLTFYFNKPIVMTSDRLYNVQITLYNKYPGYSAQLNQNQTKKFIEKVYEKYSKSLQENVIECCSVKFTFSEGCCNAYQPPSHLKGLIFSK